MRTYCLAACRLSCTPNSYRIDNRTKQQKSVTSNAHGVVDRSTERKCAGVYCTVLWGYRDAIAMGLVSQKKSPKGIESSDRRFRKSAKLQQSRPRKSNNKQINAKDKAMSLKVCFSKFLTCRLLIMHHTLVIHRVT